MLRKAVGVRRKTEPKAQIRAFKSNLLVSLNQEAGGETNPEVALRAQAYSALNGRPKEVERRKKLIVGRGGGGNRKGRLKNGGKRRVGKNCCA